MAIVRILVQGNGLLRQWPVIAPGKPRPPEAVREEIINRLTHYYDITGIPLTVVFEGPGSAPELVPFPPADGVEIICTPSAKNVAQIFERLLNRRRANGEVLVVTDDVAERSKVQAVGATLSSCSEFIQAVENSRSELEQKLSSYNQVERLKFHSQAS